MHRMIDNFNVWTISYFYINLDVMFWHITCLKLIRLIWSAFSWYNLIRRKDRNDNSLQSIFLLFEKCHQNDRITYAILILYLYHFNAQCSIYHHRVRLGHMTLGGSYLPRWCERLYGHWPRISKMCRLNDLKSIHLSQTFAVILASVSTNWQISFEMISVLWSLLETY